MSLYLLLPHSMYAPSTDKIVTVATTTTSLTTSTTATVGECSQCGVNFQGKSSCCGRFGSWRGKCGEAGENTDHTWMEGLMACLPISTKLSCSKCGINPSGKPSCCASDGAWVGKCGNEGENKDHTWFEGLKICQNE